MAKAMYVQFIQTGGTIDKDYPQIRRSYSFEIADPAVGRILRRVVPNIRYSVVTLLKKDSLDITDKDRMKIVRFCRQSHAKRIVITHGTDTMVKTARALRVIRNKIIVLTGAMRPEKFTDSDAMFNVGTAVGAMSCLPVGVFIAMNARIYPWNRCYKNIDCQFVEKT